MKLRTKLVLLLTTALALTMGFSSLLRIRWTRISLEQQLRASAQDTIDAISAELMRRLTPDLDEDGINEVMKEAQRRHPVSYLEVKLADEDTSSTYFVTPATEPQTKRRPRQVKSRPPQVRADDARRALIDQGEIAVPGERVTEPLWRTPDRAETSRWQARTPTKSAQRNTYTKGERGDDPVFEITQPFDPPDSRHGDLTVQVSRAQIEKVISSEIISSMATTAGAIFILWMSAFFIVDRVVARPVEALETAMQRVESGAMTERVEEGRSDEVGVLSRGFNAMLSRLEHADGEIRAFNRRLSDEIRSATLDLERKNDALAQMNRLIVQARRELGDKERMAALGQLAAQLAHEIGTPLGSVSGHLQLAMSSRELPTVLKERLQVASRELERVSKIVRDYLDSTRRVVPARARVDVRRVLDEAIGIAIPEQVRRQLMIEVVIEPEANEIKTDAGLLRQIIINLMTNAADAVLSQQRGTINVAAWADTTGLHISVRDNGIGINAHDVARIFEPFYTTKGRGKGTGLGLAICRELAVALGGRISVESQLEHGSTFTVHLPLGEVESPVERQVG